MTDHLDDGGTPGKTGRDVYSWEDIAAKMYNKGWPDGLGWFAVREVPEEGRELWAKALRLKAELDTLESQLNELLPDW